jgi:RNase H-like domain found in reverse transcriptase
VRAAIGDPLILVPPRTGARKRVVSGASNIGYGAVLLHFEPFFCFEPGRGEGGLDTNKKEESGLEGRLKASMTEEHGEWRPVAFIVRKLSGGEPRCTTTEKESGAFVFAIRKWRHLLDGERFEAVTDHMALRWLKNLRIPHCRLANWIVDVQIMDNWLCMRLQTANTWQCRMR